MIGNTFIKFDQLDSTNLYAELLCTNSNPKEGTVICTRYQTLGKGQIGRKWHSSHGKNALLSIILFPNFLPVVQQFYLSIITSLALRDVIHDYLPNKKISIKWPNDVYVDHKKIAGILISSTINNKKIKNCVVGIGVNINETQFPDEIPNPTSLFLENNQVVEDVDPFIVLLCRRIEEAYSMLRANKWSILKSEYEKHLYMKDTTHSFLRENGEIFDGIIKGISDDGRLRMCFHGNTEYFVVNQIRYHKPKTT